MSLPAIHTDHGRRSLALFGYVISEIANVNAFPFGQVNNHIPSTIGSPGDPRQEFIQDDAELSRSSHGSSYASFERPDNGAKDERSAGKEFQNTGTA